MSLTEKLQKQNYDLIDGPVRNHHLLQVWNKRKTDRATLYSQNISTLFDLSFQPPVIETPALTAETNEAIPIAVKAFRIRFHQGSFRELILATDNRDFF